MARVDEKKPVVVPPPPPKSEAPQVEPKVKAAKDFQKVAQRRREDAAVGQQKAHQDATTAKKAADADKVAQAQKREAREDLDRALGKRDSQQTQQLDRGSRPGDAERQNATDRRVEESQAKFDKASTRADKTARTAREARETADTSWRAAHDTANAALDAERKANTKAKEAGLTQPYPDANKVRDVFDAGSLDPKAQERLFGTRAAVTPQEAAKEDVKRVAEATQRSPREGAEELQRQLEQGHDPVYRQSLVKESAPQTEKMAASLADSYVRPEDTNATVKALAQSASLAGPEARKELVRQLLQNERSHGTLGQALKANAKDPKVVELGAEASRQHRAAGRQEAADAISDISPEFKASAPETRQEAALREEVALHTGLEEKEAVDAAQEQTDTRARERARELLDLAGKDPKDLPPGISVEPGSTKNRAVLVQKDKEGKVVERTEARVEGGKVALDSTRYDQGRAERSIVESTGVGTDTSTTVTQASWKESASGAPATPPSPDTLSWVQDPDVRYSSVKVERTRGELAQTSITRTPEGGYTQTEKRYSSQQGTGGIKRDFGEQFDDPGNPINKVATTTTQLPPAGAKDPDGKPAQATVTQGTSYFQEGTPLRVTETQSKVLESPAEGKRAPTTDDLRKVREESKDADSSPKTWTLEKSKPNELNTQVFVEGQPDLTVTTRKKVQGDTVTETSEGKVPNPDGKGGLVDIQGTTSRTYNAKGQVTSFHSDQTDANGARTVQDYARTETRNKRGEREVTERATRSETPRGGPSLTTQHEQTSVLTDKGPQLTRASFSVTGPEGSARASIAEGEGTRLTVNGKQVKTAADLQKLPREQGALGALSMDGLSQQVSDFSKTAALWDGKPNAPEAGYGRPDPAAIKTAESTSAYGLFLLKKEITTDNHKKLGIGDPSAIKDRASWSKRPEFTKQALSISLNPEQRLTGGASGALQAGAGLLTAWAGGRQLLNGLSQGNLTQEQAVTATKSLGMGGWDLYSGGLALATSLSGKGKGLSLGSLEGRRNPAIAGALSARASAGLGVVTGGWDIFQGVRADDPWRIAQGAVTAGGSAAGYFATAAAVGAFGGPAGVAVGLGIAAITLGASSAINAHKQRAIADQRI